MQIKIGKIYWLLIVVLFLMKAIGLINISWIWIFSPFWVPIGLGFALFIMALILLFICTLIRLLFDLYEKRFINN